MRGDFPLPPTSIMDEIKLTTSMDKTRLFEKAKTLQSKSGEFGVLGSVVEIHPGPVVTTYEFKPDAGVKYSKIVGLADDLALALEAESIRIDRVSGRGTVGIEIPNEVRETIYLREILEGDAFHKASSRSPSASANGQRRDLRDGPRHHAPSAHRGVHGHGQERGPQLHDREHPVQVHAGRGADDPHRPQAARARGLRGHPAPADPGE